MKLVARRYAWIALGVASLACVVGWWLAISAGWVPYVDYDTQIFEQIAAQPLGPELLVQAKPLVVPLVYRIASNDHASIVTIQAVLSIAAWTALGTVLALTVRRTWNRGVVFVVMIGFVLAPVRMGFTAALMSESIDDSMMVLVIAAAIAALHATGVRTRRAVIAGLIATGAIWLFTRDTNAPIAVTAAVAAMLVWRGGRKRRAWLALAGVVVAAGFATCTASQPHTLLAYQDNWYPRFAPRAMYPLVDNITMRVFPDDPGAVPAELGTFDRAWQGRELSVEQIIRAGSERRAVQDWIVDHGLATYARWWLSHPFDRLGELVDKRWTVLAGSLGFYMPKGWTPHAGFLRKLTSRHELLLLLMLASPLLLWRPRAHPLRGLALCTLASGLAGLVVAYYGDAAEITRHCYGSGQQIVLALFLALIAWLDGVELPARLRP